MCVCVCVVMPCDGLAVFQALALDLNHNKVITEDEYSEFSKENLIFYNVL